VHWFVPQFVVRVPHAFVAETLPEHCPLHAGAAGSAQHMPPTHVFALEPPGQLPVPQLRERVPQELVFVTCPVHCVPQAEAGGCAGRAQHCPSTHALALVPPGQLAVLQLVVRVPHALVAEAMPEHCVPHTGAAGSAQQLPLLQVFAAAPPGQFVSPQLSVPPQPSSSAVPHWPG
jgi:hypothetical protein